MGIGGINQFMQGQGALGAANPFGGAGQVPGLGDQAGLGGLAGGSGQDLAGIIQQVIGELEQLLQQLEGGGQGGPGGADGTGGGNSVDQQGGINIDGNNNKVMVCNCKDKQGNQDGTYTTPGGYKVKRDGSNVTVTSPTGQSFTESGDPHENGIDGGESTWSAKDRQIALPAGSVIGMTADAPNGAINSMNVYNNMQQAQQAGMATDNLSYYQLQNGRAFLTPAGHGANR